MRAGKPPRRSGWSGLVLGLFSSSSSSSSSLFLSFRDMIIALPVYELVVIRGRDQFCKFP